VLAPGQFRVKNVQRIFKIVLDKGFLPLVNRVLTFLNSP
jgi:hypothetical protein